jgi:hypothetical protein
MPNRRCPASHRPKATMKQAQQTKPGSCRHLARPLLHYPSAFCDMFGRADARRLSDHPDVSLGSSSEERTVSESCPHHLSDQTLFRMCEKNRRRAITGCRLRIHRMPSQTSISGVASSYPSRRMTSRLSLEKPASRRAQVSTSRLFVDMVAKCASQIRAVLSSDAVTMRVPSVFFA